MLGIIKFEHLEIPCVIGVNPLERINLQSIFVDLQIECDLSRCIHSDRIHDTIDYVQLAALCTNIAQKGEYKLLETYAYAVIEAVMDKYDIIHILIKVKKPLALENALFASVELEKFNIGSTHELDFNHRWSQKARG